MRFVQLNHGSWDDHNELKRIWCKNCDITDQPTAALLKDLKPEACWIQRSSSGPESLGERLWSKAATHKGNEGRDHHPFAFSLWLAGGGIKGGQVVGRTDEFGLNIVEDKIHIHDFHATILHCLGLLHEKLTYRHQGRDFRLTDVEGEVVTKLLA